MTTAGDADAADSTRPGGSAGGSDDSAREVEIDDRDDLVGGLLRNVDSRFSDLEQQYRLAREDLSPEADQGYFRRDAVAESSARYELVQEVATLRADLARQSAELDERDRLLSELSNRLVGFEDRLRAADEAVRGAKVVREELHEERRELARVRALLDARVAERDELADAAQRLQVDNDDLDRRLSMALERFDEVDRVRSALADDVAALEAARSAESQDHLARLDDLSDTKAEVRRLTELADELTIARDEAHKRADRSEHDVERRANEVGYLNRRIEALNGRAEQSDALEGELRRMTEENRLLARRVDDLTRDLEVRTAEAAAAARAVDAIADQNAQNELLIARVAELEAAAAAPAVVPVEQSFIELHDLADRARALGARRTAGDYEPLLGEAVVTAPGPAPSGADVAYVGEQTPVRGIPAVPAIGPDADALGEPPAADGESLAADGDALGVSLAADGDALGVSLAADGDALGVSLAADGGEPPTVSATSFAALAAHDAAADDTPEADTTVATAAEPASAEAPMPSTDEPVVVTAIDAGTTAAVAVAAAAEPASAEAPMPSTDEPVVVTAIDAAAPAVPAAPAGRGIPAGDDGRPSEQRPPSISLASTTQPEGPSSRRRVVLPAEMSPDTPQAVNHLLSQPGLTAIVDARSFCASTGIRPSELFGRMQALRDRFDLPIEVVVTPVSTPVGGAPAMPAIGVHHVTGADTVADRVRALCIGFPRDQQLVVIAGDDHVRRAAIGEEANVVDPTIVLDVT